MTTIRAKNTVNTVFLALFIFEEALDSSLSSLSRTLKCKTGIRELERSGVKEYIYIDIFFVPLQVLAKMLFFVPLQVLARFYCQNLRRYQKKMPTPEEGHKKQKNKDSPIFGPGGLQDIFVCLYLFRFWQKKCVFGTSSGFDTL